MRRLREKVLIYNTYRLRINFPFRWFRFSLRTWATAALTWAEGEHAWAEPEQSLSILTTPWVNLHTIMWNPFWPPVCPAYSFLTEFCPGISFCSLTGFPREQILDPSSQGHPFSVHFPFPILSVGLQGSVFCSVFWPLIMTD
jgi:hypothetical protein